MYLNKIDDHRSQLEKATRMELFRFAQANKVAEIVQEMPASLMRVILRQKGLTRIAIPNRVLGAPAQDRIAGAPTGPSTSIDADEDLMRQWQTQKVAPPPAPEPRAPRPTSKAAPRKRLVERPKSEINKLRDECKRLGIHMGRRDRMDDLRAKIEAHRGQNAASSDQ